MSCTLTLRPSKVSAKRTAIMLNLVVVFVAVALLLVWGPLVLWVIQTQGPAWRLVRVPKYRVTIRFNGEKDRSE
jgi:hypothetical protein